MFTTFESIITSNSIASKSISCWTSFMLNEIMTEHSIKSNELKIDSRFCLDSFESENTNSTTSRTSTTQRFMRTLNQVAISGSTLSMLSMSDTLHQMIRITSIQRCSYSLRMSTLSFVLSRSIVIILILSHFDRLSLSFLFVHQNQSIST
jgi:hypothetical protein